MLADDAILAASPPHAVPFTWKIYTSAPLTNFKLPCKDERLTGALGVQGTKQTGIYMIHHVEISTMIIVSQTNPVLKLWPNTEKAKKMF